MKFNLLSKSKTQTVNHAGAKAFIMSAEMELYTAVVTWSLNDSFYEKNETRVDRLRKLIYECKPELYMPAPKCICVRHPWFW
jgi:60 kDa SS-A/Ro ribonucleoprotein